MATTPIAAMLPKKVIQYRVIHGSTRNSSSSTAAMISTRVHKSRMAPITELVTTVTSRSTLRSSSEVLRDRWRA